MKKDFQRGHSGSRNLSKEGAGSAPLHNHSFSGQPSWYSLQLDQIVSCLLAEHSLVALKSVLILSEVREKRAQLFKGPAGVCVSLPAAHNS